ATVRINRSEFESLIDEPLDKTLDALDLAIESVGIQPSRLEAILLTGGSSRIPLIAQRLSERFDLPLVADSDPKAAVALGAARIALDRLEEGLSPDTALVAVEDASAAGSDLVPTGASAGKLRVLRPESGRSWWPKSPILLTTAAAFIAFAIVFSNTTAAGARWPDYFGPIADRAAEIVAPLIPAGSTSPPPASASPSDSDAATTTTERASTRNASQERTLPRDSSTAERHTTHANAARDPHDAAATPPRKHKAGPKVEPSGPPADETAADSTRSNSTNTPVDSTPAGKTDPPAPAQPTDDTPAAGTATPAEASDPPPSEPAPSGGTTPPSTTPATDPPPATKPAPTTPPAESTPPADEAPTPASASADPPAAAPEPAPVPEPSGGPTPEPTT
uniref:Hsp70 family protein n=1 Tax=Microbacterium sp. TaxID=51671 RepID=UPI00261EC043